MRAGRRCGSILPLGMGVDPVGFHGEGSCCHGTAVAIVSILPLGSILGQTLTATLDVPLPTLGLYDLGAWRTEMMLLIAS